MWVDATTNSHKAALRLLAVLPLAGAVVTADAMVTLADVCKNVPKSQGEYILYAKDNQAELRSDFEAIFTAAGGDFPHAGGPLAVGCGHAAV